MCSQSERNNKLSSFIKKILIFVFVCKKYYKKVFNLLSFRLKCVFKYSAVN